MGSALRVLSNPSAKKVFVMDPESSGLAGDRATDLTADGGLVTTL